MQNTRLQVFTHTLTQRGLSIFGSPAIFAVDFGGKKGSIQMSIEVDGDINLQIAGAPHQENLEQMDLMEMFSRVESAGHIIEPLSGNQYRVNDASGKLVGEFLIAPEMGGSRIILQACSATEEYRRICEFVGVVVRDFEPDEVDQYLEKTDREGSYSSGRWWE